MNEHLKSFLNGIGALTEIWTVVYKNFIKQGYGVQDSLTHTREFMAALMISTMNRNNDKEGTND